MGLWLNNRDDVGDGALWAHSKAFRALHTIIAVRVFQRQIELMLLAPFAVYEGDTVLPDLFRFERHIVETIAIRCHGYELHQFLHKTFTFVMSFTVVCHPEHRFTLVFDLEIHGTCDSIDCVLLCCAFKRQHTSHTHTHTHIIHYERYRVGRHP